MRSALRSVTVTALSTRRERNRMFVLSCSLEIVLICGPTGDASTHVFIFVVKTVRAFGDFLFRKRS